MSEGCFLTKHQVMKAKFTSLPLAITGDCVGEESSEFRTCGITRSRKRLGQEFKPNHSGQHTQSEQTIIFPFYLCQPTGWIAWKSIMKIDLLHPNDSLPQMRNMKWNPRCLATLAPMQSWKAPWTFSDEFFRFQSRLKINASHFLPWWQRHALPEHSPSKMHHVVRKLVAWISSHRRLKPCWTFSSLLLSKTQDPWSILIQKEGIQVGEKTKVHNYSGSRAEKQPSLVLPIPHCEEFLCMHDHATHETRLLSDLFFLLCVRCNLACNGQWQE